MPLGQAHDVVPTYEPRLTLERLPKGAPPEDIRSCVTDGQTPAPTIALFCTAALHSRRRLPYWTGSSH